MVKYYFILKRPGLTFRSSLVAERDLNGLYCYTDSKKLLKRFKKERDMRKFHIIERDMSSNDLDELHEWCPEGYLEEHTLTTKSSLKDSEKTFSEIPLLLVQEEYTTISRYIQAAIFSEMWIYTDQNPFIFKDKYVRALSHIGYINGYFMLTMTSQTPPEYCYSPVEDGTLMPDLFNAFLFYYGDTLDTRR